MDRVTLILNRARQAVLSRDFEFAEELLTSQKTKSAAGEDNKEILELLGELYLKSENFSKALAVFEKLNSLSPANVEILNNLGVIYRRLTQYEKSIEVLKQARAAGDNSSTLLYNMGNTYKEMQFYDEAAQCFSEVLEMNPDDVLAYNHLGTIEFLNGNLDKSLHAYKLGLQRDQNHPFIHFNLARLYRFQGKPLDAEKEYMAAVKNRPAWVQALRELASLYDSIGDTEKYIDTLKRILSVDAKNVQALLDYAEFSGKHERIEEAKTLFEKAVRIADSDSKPSLAFAAFLRSIAQVSEALATLENFNKRHPGSMDVMLDLAEMYMNQFQYPKVRELFTECEKIDSDNLKFLSLQGRFYITMGDNERARFYLARIFSIAPTKVEFRMEFAAQLAEAGLLPEAEEQITAYLNEKPSDHGARIILGAIYEQMENFDSAAACYKTVIAEEKDNFQANTALSLLYQRMGKTMDAVRLADEMVNLQGSRASEEDLASLGKSISLYEQAVDQYKTTNPSVTSRNLELLHRYEDSAAPGDAGSESQAAKTQGDDENDSPPVFAEDEAAFADPDSPYTTEELLPDQENAGESETSDEDLSEIFNTADTPASSPDKGGDFIQDENEFLEEIPEDFDAAVPENEILLSEETEEEPQEERRPSAYEPPPPVYQNIPPISYIERKPDRETEPANPVEVPAPAQKPPAPHFEPARKEASAANAAPPTPEADDEYECAETPDASVVSDGTDAANTPAPLDMHKKTNAPFSPPYEHAARDDLGPMPPFGFPLRSPVLDLHELELALNDIPSKSLLELFKYIRKITETLPEKLFSEYLISEERIILEYIIDKLSGNPGIRYNNLAKAVYEKSKADGILHTHDSGEQILTDTFSFLETLVSELPDKGFATRLKKHVEDIKSRIENDSDTM